MINYTFFKRKIFTHRGFTLGMTMMISSLVLMLSFSIYSLMYREINIANIGNQSVKAYYNADLGIECVKYYEDKYITPNSNPNSPLTKVYINGGIIADAKVTKVGFFLGSDEGWDSAQVTDGGIAYPKANQYILDIRCAGFSVSKDRLNVDNTGTAAKYDEGSVANFNIRSMITGFSIKNVDADVCVDIKVYKSYQDENILKIISTGYNSCRYTNGQRVSREVVYERGLPPAI